MPRTRRLGPVIAVTSDAGDVGPLLPAADFGGGGAGKVRCGRCVAAAEA